MLNNTWLGKLVKELYNSFNDKDGTGFDERKLSGFAVINSAVIIGLTYAYNLYNCKIELSWEGVLLVTVLLLFGALFLMILNPKQIERILAVVYNKKLEETTSTTIKTDSTEVKNETTKTNSVTPDNPDA